MPMTDIEIIELMSALNRIVCSNVAENEGITHRLE